MRLGFACEPNLDGGEAVSTGTWVAVAALRTGSQMKAAAYYASKAAALSHVKGWALANENDAST